MIKVNTADLIKGIKKETEATPAIEKTASLSENLGGRPVSEIEKIASDLSAEVGFEVKLSGELEKVASDMAGATSVDEIVKIAQESGNDDIAHIANIAGSFADVVVARVQDQLKINSGEGAQ